MKIGICDDDVIWLENETKIIEEYLINKRTEYQLKVFHNVQDLLDYNDHLDILFMDIQINGDSGIDAIKIINDRYPHCAIIYVTNYIYYASDVYSTIHSFFVLKDKLHEKIEEIFNKCIHQLSQDKKILFHMVGSSQLSLSVNEILYFERHQRITHIHTINNIYDIHEKINEIEKRLPDIDFVRCHNSYIIYIPAIKILNNDYIVLKDNTEITISRPYKKHVKEVFMKWAGTQII